jgi:hopanoid biosynthesis associated protein HpnK
MKSLIVNADDFGLTAGVNRAVIEGHERGIITSATLMANMPGFDEAARLARAHPSLGVGLHFNLTQGRPVAEAAQVHSLTNARGEFLGTGAMVAWRSLAGGLRTEEIRAELRAQLEKARAAGIQLTHIDSHHHIHALPQVFAAIARVLPECGIRAVRLPQERWRGAAASPKIIKQSVVAAGLAQLCRADRALLKSAGLRAADAFFGLARTGCWTKDWLLDVVARLPDGVSELMCHPGYEDGELRQARTRLLGARAVELKLLTEPEIAARLREREVELVNYSQVEAA